MQWTGQKVMFDLRNRNLPGPAAHAFGFFDKNGRPVSARHTDVDALNEMFTAVWFHFSKTYSYSRIIAIMMNMTETRLITFPCSRSSSTRP